MANSKTGIHRRLTITITDALRRRFWSRVDKGPDADCWEWKAAMRNGYGAIKHQKRVHSAHRLAYVLTFGEPDDGLVIAHKCDNRACCNPNHLEAITPGQNNRDARGRRTFHMTRGEDLPNAVLTEALVREARQLSAEGMSGAQIAARFGMHRSTVEKAIAGKTWRHVK